MYLLILLQSTTASPPPESFIAKQQEPKQQEPVSFWKYCNSPMDRRHPGRQMSLRPKTAETVGQAVSTSASNSQSPWQPG